VFHSQLPHAHAIPDASDIRPCAHVPSSNAVLRLSRSRTCFVRSQDAKLIDPLPDAIRCAFASAPTHTPVSSPRLPSPLDAPDRPPRRSPLRAIRAALTLRRPARERSGLATTAARLPASSRTARRSIMERGGDLNGGDGVNEGSIGRRGDDAVRANGIAKALVRRSPRCATRARRAYTCCSYMRNPSREEVRAHRTALPAPVRINAPHLRRPPCARHRTLTRKPPLLSTRAPWELVVSIHRARSDLAAPSLLNACAPYRTSTSSRVSPCCIFKMHAVAPARRTQPHNVLCSARSMRVASTSRARRSLGTFSNECQLTHRQTQPHWRALASRHRACTSDHMSVHHFLRQRAHPNSIHSPQCPPSTRSVMLRPLLDAHEGAGYRFICEKHGARVRCHDLNPTERTSVSYIARLAYNNY
jgi:hypothetical protein